MKVNFKNIILLIAIVALMIVGVSIFNGITKEQDEIVYGKLLLHNIVREIAVKGKGRDSLFLLHQAFEMEAEAKPPKDSKPSGKTTSVMLPQFVFVPQVLSDSAPDISISSSALQPVKV